MTLDLVTFYLFTNVTKGLSLALRKALWLLVIRLSTITTPRLAGLDVVTPTVAVEALNATLSSVLVRATIATCCLAIRDMMRSIALDAHNIAALLLGGNAVSAVTESTAVTERTPLVSKEVDAISNPITLGAGYFVRRFAHDLMGKVTEVSSTASIAPFPKVTAIFNKVGVFLCASDLSLLIR